MPLNLIRQVIAFYLDNRSEVDAYVEACRAEIERQAAAPPGPGTIRIRQLMERIRQADLQKGADPEWVTLSAMEKLRRLEMENGSKNT